MKSKKTKQDLIDTVVNQMRQDVHYGDYSAVEGLLALSPAENLIAYLPEKDWKEFNHLVVEEHLKKEEDDTTT
jgi:hypothetical protein